MFGKQITGYLFTTKGKKNLRFQFKWLYRWKWFEILNLRKEFCKFPALFASSDNASPAKQRVR